MSAPRSPGSTSRRLTNPSVPELKIMWSRYTLGCTNPNIKGEKTGLNANTAPQCFFKNLACGIIDMDRALKTYVQNLK